MSEASASDGIASETTSPWPRIWRRQKSIPSSPAPEDGRNTLSIHTGVARQPRNPLCPRRHPKTISNPSYPHRRPKTTEISILSAPVSQDDREIHRIISLKTHVEWLSSSGRTGVRVAPLPRSLASLKREISEKKWAEARQWAGGRTSKTKYRMPKSQKPDGAVADSTKRLASTPPGNSRSSRSTFRTSRRSFSTPFQRGHLFREWPE